MYNYQDPMKCGPSLTVFPTTFPLTLLQPYWPSGCFLSAADALGILWSLGPRWLQFPLLGMAFPRQLCGILLSFGSWLTFHHVIEAGWLWSSYLKFQSVPCNTYLFSLYSFLFCFVFECPILYLLFTITLENFFFLACISHQNSCSLHKGRNFCLSCSHNRTWYRCSINIVEWLKWRLLRVWHEANTLL